VITQFDNRRSFKHSLGVNDQLAVLQGIDVGLDQQQIRAALHWQEALAGDVSPVCVLEVLDGCGLELPLLFVSGLIMISTSTPSSSMTRLSVEDLELADLMKKLRWVHDT